MGNFFNALTSLASPVLSFASDLFGGISNANAQKEANATNLQIARETNEQQYKMFKEQLGYQTSERIAQQEYNSPSHQRSLYEQAGINPYHMLGSMNPNTVAQSAPSAPSQHVPTVNPVTGYGDMFKDIGNDVGTVLQNEALGLDNQSKRIDLIYKHAEKRTSLANELQRFENMKFQNDETKQRIANLKKELEVIDTNLSILQDTKPAQVTLKKAEARKAQLVADAQELANDYQKWFNDFSKTKGKKELAVMQSIIANNLAFANLANKQSALVAYEKVVREAEKQGIELDNQQKRMLRGHVLKMARLTESATEADTKYKEYMTGVNGRDILGSVTSTLGTALGVAGAAYGASKGAKGASSVRGVSAQPVNPIVYY